MIDVPSERTLPPVVGRRTLSFEENAVVKHQSLERTRVELIKTELGAEIGRATGLFRTPAILAQDPAAGLITFERLRGYCDLQQALSTVSVPDRLVRRVARSLAAIHDRLQLPDGYAIPMRGPGLELGTPPVFIHGDFAAGNLLYDTEQNDLVVLDWSITDWLPDATLAPPYVDLTILLQSLFTRRPFGPHPLRDRWRLTRTLLDTYWDERSSELRADEFDRCFSVLISTFLRTCGRQKGWRFLAYQPSLLRTMQLVRQFCRERANCS